MSPTARPAHDDRILQRLLVFAALLCLLASVTNEVPFAGTMVVLAPLIPFALAQRPALPKVLVPTFLMLLYFLVSTVLYDPRALLSFGFLRRDGNVFVTYAPLCVLALFHLRIDAERLFRHFALWASAINIVNLVLWLGTARTFSGFNPAHYPFLFKTHNATGGFLAVLAGITLALSIHERGRWWLWGTGFLGALGGLVLTGSRGSILGLLAGLAFVIVPIRLRVVGISLLAVANVVAVIYLHGIVDIDTALNKDAFSAAAVANNENIETMEDQMSRSQTLVNRLLDHWPSAWHHFLDSPFVGTGFGSYNDIPYAVEGIPGLLAWKTPGAKVHSASHAHHSYLHILAETGLIGLGLFILSLTAIYRFILNDLPRGALRLSLHIMFWTAVVASFTEHRFFTPSQMLPFMILLGLTIAARRQFAHRARRLEATAKAEVPRPPP